jgi:two-component system, chemotaxis family, protein-glutamate methylesterase/glutaminase
MIPPIRVMIVDDSALVRHLVTQAIARDPDIEVVATAADPAFALDKLRHLCPDVILLDIEMPGIDCLVFLRQLMSERPTPVIVCATLAEGNAETTLQALAAGAVSVLSKPKVGLKDFLQEAADDWLHAIHSAARSQVGALRQPAAALAHERPRLPHSGWSVFDAEDRPKYSADVILPAGHEAGAPGSTDRVIAIGTSTGGTQALEAVLTQLPPTIPGLIIVQHMPERFTSMFAARLNDLCQIEVREARSNDRVLPGLALIAPGGQHMLLRRRGAHYHVEVIDGPLVNRHKPSVDVLFRSVAKYAGSNATGVIMTGMGDDGAHGLKEMRDAGAATIAQDEASCVVFGMPKEAIRLGGADRVLPLGQIAAALVASAPG